MDFYKFFDTIEFVPVYYLRYFKLLLKKGKVIEASRLFVPIKFSLLKKYKYKKEVFKYIYKDKLIEKDIIITNLNYSPITGLEFQISV